MIINTRYKEQITEEKEINKKSVKYTKILYLIGYISLQF